MTTAQSVVVVDSDRVRVFRGEGDEAWEEALAAAPLDATSDGASVYISLADNTIVVVSDDLADYAGVKSTFATYGDITATGATYGNLPNLVNAPVLTVWTTLPNPATMLTYTKGFLVAGVENRLYDVSLGTADDTTLFYSAPLLGHRWIDGTDGLAAGYLLGGQGDKWFVYWVTVRDDAATLNPPVVAAPLPEGEIGYSLGSYLGFVLVGTERGVRFCTPAGDNTLTYGRLIVTDTPVRNFEGQDRYVWFGIGGVARDLVEPLRQPEAGLARLDLSVFTAPLTPAFAADLIAGDDILGNADQVITFNGKRIFHVEDGGIYVEQDTYAKEGWLQEGVFNQQVRDKKIALYASISCEPLTSGSIEVALTPDSAEFPNPQIILNAPGSVSSGNTDLNGMRFEGLVVQHTLKSNTDQDETPRMTRFEFRSVPVVGRAHEWQVPLLVFEALDFENMTMGRDPDADLQHLINLVESGRLFTYREAGREHTCYSPGYVWRPEKLAADGQSWQGTCLLRIRSLR